MFDKQKRREKSLIIKNLLSSAIDEGLENTYYHKDSPSRYETDSYHFDLVEYCGYGGAPDILKMYVHFYWEEQRKKEMLENTICFFQESLEIINSKNGKSIFVDQSLVSEDNRRQGKIYKDEQLRICKKNNWMEYYMYMLFRKGQFGAFCLYDKTVKMLNLLGLT